MPTPIWIVEPSGTRPFYVFGDCHGLVRGNVDSELGLESVQIDRLEVRRGRSEPVRVDLVNYLLDGGSSIVGKSGGYLEKGLAALPRRLDFHELVDLICGHEAVAEGAYEGGIDLEGDLSRALREAALVPGLGSESDLSEAVGRGGDGQHHVQGFGFAGSLVVGLEGQRKRERRVWREALVFVGPAQRPNEVLDLDTPSGFDERAEIELRH